MIETARPVTARDPLTITQSRTSWGIEVGRHRLTVTRMREARIVGGSHASDGRATAPRSIWPVAIGTFASVSAFGLFVFGAVASEPLSFSGHPRYSISVPLPARTTPLADAQPVHAVRLPRAKAALRSPILSDARVVMPDETYVARAMRTGEFQEWLDADGQRHFLSAGPEEADGARRCRALAMLIRRTDGGNEVRNSRRCASGPISDKAVADLEGSAPSYAVPDIALVSPQQDVVGGGDPVATQ